MNSRYDGDFYAKQSGTSLQSARVILGSLFPYLNPASVVDVGCGVGTWLRAARELGARQVVGVDGSYVDPRSLMIDPAEFIAADLEQEGLGAVLTAIGKARFDLVISVEVAEHLSFARAESFVKDLTELGDVVLFSAAIPFQGGQHHANEQWPEFWAILFRSHGFHSHDLIRPAVWGCEEIDWWYAQNAIVFVKHDSVVAGSLPAVIESKRPSLSLVHPQNYLSQILKWFHSHRRVAAHEEYNDFATLAKAYADGAKKVPSLIAPSRAATNPDRTDIFPWTRSDRFDPESALESSHEALRINADNIRRYQAKLESSHEALRINADNIRRYQAKLESAHEALRIDADNIRRYQAKLNEVQSRLEELQQSRVVRLARKYYSLYTAPGIGVVLRHTRHRVGTLMRMLERPNTTSSVVSVEIEQSDSTLQPVSAAESPIQYASAPFPILGEVREILIMKLDHIGDFVLGLPAFQLLRQTFPKACITLLCGPWNRDLAEGSACFDRIYCLSLLPEVSGNYTKGKLDFDPSVIANFDFPEFDIAIDFRDEPDTRFLLCEIKARFRAGFRAAGVASYMDLAFPSTGWHLMAEGQTHHQTLQILLAASVVAVQDGARAMGEIVGLVSQTAEPASLPPRESGLLIGINVGSGSAGKNWPLEHFEELAKRLIAETHTTVMLFGSKQQQTDSARLADCLPPASVINLAGQISLPQSIATMRRLDCYIGNDTGTTHIAAALGIPTVCLFGTETTFESHGVIGNRCISLLANEQGMESIHVDDVVSSVRRLVLLPAEPYRRLPAASGPTEQTIANQVATSPEPVALTGLCLVVIDNKSYESDFRKYLMSAAIRHGGDALHVRCWREAILTHGGRRVDTSAISKEPGRIADEICSLLGHRKIVVMVGLGLSRDYLPLVRCLRRHRSTAKVLYDVFDYFRYDKRGREFLRLLRLDLCWRRETDKTLLLEPGLRPIYPRSWHLDNASHMQRLDGPAKADDKKMVYIGSIDRRVDFEWLEVFARLDVTLDIYGRCHDAEPEIARRLREFVDAHENVRYHGGYDNDDLPRILNEYRIGIIPYRTRYSMTKHVNPDKLYHYLNAGLEVIASDIPQTRRAGRFVHLVASADGIPAALAAARREPRNARWVAGNNTWDRRWEQIMELLKAP